MADGAEPPAKEKKNPWTWEEIDGILYPGFIFAEQLEKLKSFNPRPSDIFVCTYPKGGSHWIGFIVHLVMNNGVENREVPFHHICPWLEAAGLSENISKLEDVERLPNPRFFFSHAYYNQMPGGAPNTSPAKYIYVARNPKDTFVSYYHFHFKMEESGNMVFGRTWKQFFDEFVRGRVFFGSWWDQIPEWWKHRDEKNVLFLKYEDLKKDLPKYVKIIADFLGYDLEQDVITKIAAMSTFEEMKTNMAMGSNSQIFMRKGVVGNWKGQLSEEESAIIDRRYAEAVNGTGLEFDFGN
jgi:hypothetical protein